MASVLESELLTVAEAAALLKVSRVTISRWMKQGRLAGYRVGPRAVRIRREDVAGMITPTNGGREGVEMPAEREPKEVIWPEPDPAYVALLANIRPMTEERKQALREAIEGADDLRRRMHERRGGRPFPDSAVEIREAREERSKQMDAW